MSLQLIHSTWNCRPRRFINVVRHFMGRTFFFGAGIKFYPASAKAQGRVHVFGTKVFSIVFIEYVVNAERRWTGDLLIADTDDVKNDANI